MPLETVTSGIGEWYTIMLIAAFSTFFGMVSIKLGDTITAIREIAENTRTQPDEPPEDIDYEEKYPRFVNIKGFFFSTKGIFTIIGLMLLLVGWLPVLIKIKELIGLE